MTARRRGAAPSTGAFLTRFRAAGKPRWAQLPSRRTPHSRTLHDPNPCIVPPPTHPHPPTSTRAQIGATNFDTPRLAALVDAGVEVATHQVQYSLLDRRPSLVMADYCASKGISLLPYGVVAGGFLSDRCGWGGGGGGA